LFTCFRLDYQLTILLPGRRTFFLNIYLEFSLVDKVQS
jgi:hypothetical protein